MEVSLSFRITQLLPFDDTRGSRPYKSLFEQSLDHLLNCSCVVHQFMGAIGRKCSVVNLDPANDQTSYPCALDVRDLITLDEIMKDEELGPNGGVLYALEELEHNIDWLEQGLGQLGGKMRMHKIVLKRLVRSGCFY